MSKTPALNPLTFKEVITKDTAEKTKRQTERARFQMRALRRMAPMFTVKPSFSVFYDSSVQDPWSEVLGYIRNAELRYLWAEPYKNIRLTQFFHRPADTPPYKRFMALRAQYECPLGVIFPLSTGGEWLLHNLGWPEGQGPGYSRVVIQSKKTDIPDLCIEPLPQFVRIYSNKGAEYE